MESRAKAFGHAVHPMLIVFPLGLLITSVAFDIIYLASDRSSFAVASAYTIAAGLIGGLAAAVFGLVDWFAIPAGSRAKRVGALHGLGNAVVVVLFAVSWLLRAGADRWQPGVAALVCSFVGIALGGLTAWLGGELVERLGIGVDDGADVNATSSLSGSILRRRQG
jgi:uncharacterized membrane protein